MAKPSQADQLLLWAWCIGCFVGTTALFVYLPMSTQPAWAHLSEYPTPLTVLFSMGALTAVGVLRMTWNRPVFQGPIRGALIVGTLSSVLGVAGYGGYVYAFSQTLAVAQSAPNVGEPAPDFRVVDPEGRAWSLQPFRGSPVLLVFYRGHW